MDVLMQGSIFEQRTSEFSKTIGRRIQVFSSGGGMFSSHNKLHMAENIMKDVKKYADMDIDELLSKLSPEELEQLGNMVDPDDSLIPPSERCRTQTKKKPTGPLNRRHLLQFLEKFAREQEDWPEAKPFQAGSKRGKVFVPRVQPKPKQDDDVEVELDIGEDYEKALNTANESELVDLAAILGLHSMLSQDQYHNSVTNRRQRPGTGFDSLVKASMPKPMPMEPDNDTNTHQTAEKVAANDPSLKTLNWNNIKNIRRDDFKKLFEGLKKNTNLESLSLANTDLTDSLVKRLIDAVRHNKTLKSLNVESNYISGPVIKDLVEATNAQQSLEDLRASNQRPSILGNKIEMEIARLVEKNRTLLRLGISFDVPDARMRITQHLQNNYDRLRLRRTASGAQLSST
ncbi:tropomodulin isoform X1 [Dermacentor andersoni]|uniref:tropomodulin isoform X1 n=2 Tax=Dermacentor andersoni TaxID=34620 RepID=UPI00215576DE|nr:tropomodulin-like isoform X1 [Dermacentor andersoni]